jgi:hypothetical protein
MHHIHFTFFFLFSFYFRFSSAPEGPEMTHTNMGKPPNEIGSFLSPITTTRSHAEN